jgi:hypothetical protein
MNKCKNNDESVIFRLQEMAQISEKVHADFGAGVSFRVVPRISTVTLA